MKKSKAKRNEQKKWFVVFIIGLALVAGVYLIGQRTNLIPEAASPFSLKSKAKAIKSTADLDQTLNDLESVDFEEFDKNLQDNNMDASSF